MSQMNFSMANISIISNDTSVHQKPEAFTFSAQTKVMLFSILLVWSLLGNILVIAIIILNKNLRTNFNCLIVNMAVSDLFIPLLILPLKIVQETNGPDWLVYGPLGEALCKLVYFLTDISPLVSILSLVIITVNRFVSITYPMKIGALRGKTSWVLIAFTWIAPMALLSPYFYTFRLTKRNGITHCISLWTPAFDDFTARTIFITLVIVVAFLVPLAAILVLYSLMLYQLKKGSDKVIHMLNNRQLLFRQRRNKQIFYFCIAIIASFVCLLGPFFCFMFVLNFVWRWDFKGRVVKIRTILFAVQFLAHLNPAINPCIYFLFLKEYRKGLKRLLVDSKGKLSRRRKSTKISTLLEYLSLGKVRRNKSTSV